MAIDKIKITSPDTNLKGRPDEKIALARVGHLNKVVEQINAQVLFKGEIEPLEASEDLEGVDGTGDNAAPLVETEARLDAIEEKINQIIDYINGQA